MGIIRNFDKHKYNIPTQGGGIVDTVVDFISQNKDTLKDVGKAVSSVSETSGNISKAIQAAKQFNELHEKKKQSKLPPSVVSELQEVAKKGDGFEKF